jgi:hypothetical protein
MLVSSPITVWSIGPVPEPEIVPEKSALGADHPFALVGSVDVL